MLALFIVVFVLYVIPIYVGIHLIYYIMRKAGYGKMGKTVYKPEFDIFHFIYVKNYSHLQFSFLIRKTFIKNGVIFYYTKNYKNISLSFQKKKF